MFGYLEANLKLIYNVLYLVFLIIASAGISYFLYRKTNPPVSPFYKSLLILLRGIALALILLIFFEPILSVTKIIHKKVNCIVLIDNSSSAGIKDNKYDRKSVIKNILSETGFDDLAKKCDLNYYLFSNIVKKISKEDTLDFLGEGTNIGKALKEVMEQNNENESVGIILITDGIYNLGENPVNTAKGLRVPAYTVGVGDSSEQNDILIKNIIFNRITYINNKVSVDVLIRNIGFQGEKSTITLSDGLEVLDTKVVELPENMREKIVSLEFIANREGLNEYKLSLMPVSGESILENNQRSFFVKVLKNKIRILLIGGRPDTDYGFLVRALSKDENIELTAFVEKRGGSLFSYDNSIFPENLDNFDVVFFIFYPTDNTLIKQFEILREGIEKRRLPLFVMIGKTGLQNGINLLRNLIPLESSIVTNTEFEAYVKLTEEGKNHPVMRMMDMNIDNLNIWKNLPPFYYSGKNFVPKEGNKVIAVIDNGRTKIVKNHPNIPFISSSIIGERKYIFINGYGLWRWDLLLKDDDEFAGVYDKFFGNAVRWLVNREEEKRVRIYTDKEVYNSGEEVLISAQVYDDNYYPIGNAEVKVLVNKDDLILERILDNIGGGNYQGELEIIEPGNYKYRGEANYYERKIGEDSGEFSVGKFSIEMLNTRMRSDILKSISQVSGGKFYYPEKIQNLFNDLSDKEIEIIEKNEIEIYNKGTLMIIVVILLSCEWFVRKRLGML